MSAKSRGLFAKIPNNFFYKEGELLEKIGGRNSFALYCLIVSRKNMSNKMYITIREINRVLSISKNITDARNRILKYLSLLKGQKLIGYNFNINETKNNDFIEIEWIDNFPDKKDSGWVAFYHDDFDILYSIGTDFYTLHWILRMYVHHEKSVSFVSIKHMSSIMRCRTTTVQNAVDLFGYSELFKITRSEYYYNHELKRKMKNNNEYRYTNEKDWILRLGRNQ